MYNFYLQEKKIIFDPIFFFLTIDICKNLQEYFFVRNQFLILKNEEENAKILNLRNILA